MTGRGEQGPVACDGDGVLGSGWHGEFCLEGVASGGLVRGASQEGILQELGDAGGLPTVGFTGTTLISWLGISFSEPQSHVGGPSRRLRSWVSLALVLSASLPETGSTSAQGPAGSWPSAGSREEEPCVWDQ